MLSQDAQMLLSFCFWFVFTDVIKYYTSQEGNLDSISCPFLYRAAQTLMCQPQSRTANQTKVPCKAMVIFPLGFESAFWRVFLIPIKSGFNNPLALIRGWYCDDTQSRSGWVGVCRLPIARLSVSCADLPDPWEMRTAIPRGHKPQFWATQEQLQIPPSVLVPQTWSHLLAPSNCTKFTTSLQILANICLSHTHHLF